MHPDVIDSIRKKLERSRREIEERQAGWMAELADSPRISADTLDQAAREVDLGLSLAFRDRDRARLAEIRAALSRIGDGAYGVCEECGEDIAPARLLAFPSTTMCVHCKERLESEQAWAMVD